MYCVWYVKCMHVHYYTRPFFNLANDKQHASNKQALLFSILAFTPSQRCGLYSTVAISDLRWRFSKFWAQNSSVAPKGVVAKLGGAFSKLRIFCLKTAFFWPKTAPEPI